ncbi:MAG: hypothetical protein JWM55_608 [Acidimicrobiaceae bacterium]|nr:hypothetical protein [Acidimicrobiaceae bacterium]
MTERSITPKRVAIGSTLSGLPEEWSITSSSEASYRLAERLDNLEFVTGPSTVRT